MSHESASAQGGDITFDVIHHDGWIRVCIAQGVATLHVENINDVEVMVRAINLAAATGATSGTMFTGQVVNDRSATKHLRRVERGITFLGGKFTRRDDGEDGPQFRVDWDEFPAITE